VHRVITAILKQEAKSPISWGALLLSAIAWPFALFLSPLATTLTNTSATLLAYNVAFLSALAGAIYADHRLEELRWLMSRRQSSAAGLLEFGAMASGALLPSALALLPIAFLKGVHPLAAFGFLALVSLHIAALLHLLKSMRFSASARSLLMLFLALLSPASIPSDAGPFSFLWRIADPLAGGPLGGLTFLTTTAQMGSIVTVLLVARALRPLTGR